MEYKVGSLAAMITRPSTKKTPKSKKETGALGATIEFKKVTIPKVKSGKSISKKKRKMEDGESQHKRLRFSDPIEISSTTSGSKNADQQKKKLERYEQKRELIDVQPTNDENEELRTVFVGNLANTTEANDLKRFFSPYGPIENIRFRSASVANPKLTKKLAVIKREFHPSRSNINAYIKYKNVKSAHKALAANGMIVDEHTLRVDMSQGSVPNQKACIFLGNLKFETEEENLRKMFEDCGDIVNVRIIREKETGIGKGIAFIEFKNSECVELALKLDGEDLLGRPVRVARVKGPSKKVRKERTKVKADKKDKKQILHQKLQGGVNAKDIKSRASQEAKNKKTHVTGAKQKLSGVSEFQGEKTDNVKAKKKKKKQNKGELKKKIMQSKLGIIPKSKKMKVANQK